MTGQEPVSPSSLPMKGADRARSNYQRHVVRPSERPHNTDVGVAQLPARREVGEQDDLESHSSLLRFSGVCGAVDGVKALRRYLVK
jgi:hypothetical protein